MTPKPLTAAELHQLAHEGKPIPADRVLATFADPKNWVQIYGGTTSCPAHYVAKACEWAFIGPIRPPYELAEMALQPKRVTDL